MSAPTTDEIKKSVSGQYKSLIRRRIGRRYWVAHVNWSVLAVGAQWCPFGIIWFVGPFSFCLSRPSATDAPDDADA